MYKNQNVKLFIYSQHRKNTISLMYILDYSTEPKDILKVIDITEEKPNGQKKRN